ncbi:MAG: J domain-containing protein, partial [Alphaproteobacteria bacterium]|nr:J domain-containing protein [Alphaproteobacteria bacterium]
MTKEQAYSMLGITPSATDDEIRRAWRKLALQYHPDKNPCNKAAEDKIKQVNEAYRTLKQKNAPGAERFTSNVDDWYDAVLMSMLNKAIDSMKTSGHPNSLFTFIDILNHMQNKNIDAETKQKIEQLNQIA